MRILVSYCCYYLNSLLLLNRQQILQLKHYTWWRTETPHLELELSDKELEPWLMILASLILSSTRMNLSLTFRTWNLLGYSALNPDSPLVSSYLDCLSWLNIWPASMQYPSLYSHCWFSCRLSLTSYWALWFPLWFRCTNTYFWVPQ